MRSDIPLGMDVSRTGPLTARAGIAGRADAAGCVSGSAATCARPPRNVPTTTMHTANDATTATTAATVGKNRRALAAPPARRGEVLD